MFPQNQLILKRLCRGSRDYLIGGNKIPWWLAGASIFMMSFSAWTFTGAAGFAYEYGIRIILIYSTLSGSWAVMTTDFLQSIILMTLSVVIAALTLVEAGGPGPLFRPDASDRELFIASRVFNFLTALVVIAVGLGLRRLGAPRRNETHLGS